VRFYLQGDDLVRQLELLCDPSVLALELLDASILGVEQRLATDLLGSQALDAFALELRAPVLQVRGVQALAPQQRAELTALGAPEMLAVARPDAGERMGDARGRGGSGAQDYGRVTRRAGGGCAGRGAA
jgi:hypothetical protein